MMILKKLLLTVTLLGTSALCFGQDLVYGKYVGNGSSQSITGLGFAPDILIVKSRSTRNAHITTRTMANTHGNGSKILATSSNAISTAITSLDADGFTVGSHADVNTNNDTLYFIAFQNTEGAIGEGTYTGDGVGINRDITVGFQPDFLIVFTNVTGIVSRIKFNGITTLDFATGRYISSNDIIFIANGVRLIPFSSLSPSAMNANGVVHYYVAFKNVAGAITTGQYTGNSSFAPIKTSENVGFEPKFVLVRNDWGGSQRPVMRMGNNFGAESMEFNNVANTTSKITSLTTVANSFSIGTHAQVNSNSNTYSYIAFGNGVGLPISLVYFDAKPTNQSTVDVTWRTESEINNAFFTVERSANGNNFEEVARVSGAGNSSKSINYKTTDYSPLPGTSYYRLKQTDFDGTFTYSRIVAVQMQKQSSLTISPNPAGQDGIRIHLSESNESRLSIQITDALGKVVYINYLDKKDGEFTTRINTSWLSSGVYFITVSGGATLEAQKLIVE